jgi:hypothetical protein
VRDLRKVAMFAVVGEQQDDCDVGIDNGFDVDVSNWESRLGKPLKDWLIISREI